MSLYIPLPFEFVVAGIPLSLQSSAKSKEQWKQTVRDAARQYLTGSEWALETPLAITIYIFHKDRSQAMLITVLSQFSTLSQNSYILMTI